jgi:hypothetical protein
MANRIELTRGDRFGKLTVLSDGETIKLPSGQLNRTVICKCDCGNIKQIRLLHLIRGRISSCGCLGGIRHGDTKKKIYKSWRAMIYRCYKSPYYNGYADKGITVCDEWRNSYLSFKQWALSNGYSDNLQIDRIDNSKGYSPDNCRYVTGIENANNKTSTLFVNYHGETIPFMNVVYDKKVMLHEHTIRCRIKRGWSADRAFDEPIRSGNYKRVSFTEDQAIERYRNKDRTLRSGDKRTMRRL